MQFYIEPNGETTDHDLSRKEFRAAAQEAARHVAQVVGGKLIRVTTGEFIVNAEIEMPLARLFRVFREHVDLEPPVFDKSQNRWLVGMISPGWMLEWKRGQKYYRHEEIPDGVWLEILPYVPFDNPWDAQAFYRLVCALGKLTSALASRSKKEAKPNGNSSDVSAGLGFGPAH